MGFNWRDELKKFFYTLILSVFIGYIVFEIAASAANSIDTLGSGFIAAGYFIIGFVSTFLVLRTFLGIACHEGIFKAVIRSIAHLLLIMGLLYVGFYGSHFVSNFEEYRSNRLTESSINSAKNKYAEAVNKDSLSICEEISDEKFKNLCVISLEKSYQRCEEETRVAGRHEDIPYWHIDFFSNCITSVLYSTGDLEGCYLQYDNRFCIRQDDLGNCIYDNAHFCDRMDHYMARGTFKYIG